MTDFSKTAHLPITERLALSGFSHKRTGRGDLHEVAHADSGKVVGLMDAHEAGAFVEIYEALKDMVHAFESDPKNRQDYENQALDDARAALKKAQGAA